MKFRLFERQIDMGGPNIGLSVCRSFNKTWIVTIQKCVPKFPCQTSIHLDRQVIYHHTQTVWTKFRTFSGIAFQRSTSEVRHMYSCFATVATVACYSHAKIYFGFYPRRILRTSSTTNIYERKHLTGRISAAEVVLSTVPKFRQFKYWFYRFAHKFLLRA